MTKGKSYVLWVAIAILIVLVVLFLLIYKANKPQLTQKLTDDDFKIIDASWNIYQTKYDNVQQTYIPDTSLPRIDWNYYCSGCKGNLSQFCELANWQMTTTQSTDLLCDFYYDGVKDLTTPQGYHSFLKNGTTYFGLGNALSITDSHDIKICCTSNSGEKSGEICKSVTLLAKC